MMDWKSVTTGSPEDDRVEGQSENPRVSRNRRDMGHPRVIADHHEFSVWARRWTLAGTAGWATVALLARLEFVQIGIIELLFLFAPLVIVPLGMELQRIRSGASGVAFRLAQMLQPLGAVMAIVAMCLPPGKRAALFAMGWMFVCGLATLSGAVELLGEFASKRARVAWVQIAFAVAKIDLAVGGAWLVASRLGLHPMGIQEPIGLLTAVHFHFAGFATATIAATTLHFAEQRGDACWFRRIVALVILMPYLVAVGFVTAPWLKMVAGIIFSCSVAALAAFLWKYTRAVEEKTARIFLRIAASVIFAGMALSAAYAITDFVGSEALPIPRMASTHGVINAVGFCMFGLLGWIVESEPEQSDKMLG
jgi:hypothetical protein